MYYHSILDEEHDGVERLVTGMQFNKPIDNKSAKGWVYWLAGKAGYVLEESLSQARETPIDGMKLRVEMEDGRRWDVPVGVIAVSHAYHYKGDFDGCILKSFSEGTVPLFVDDEDEPEVDEIINWAKGHLNWRYVKQYAIEAPWLEPDYEQGWVNGYKEVLYE